MTNFLIQNELTRSSNGRLNECFKGFSFDVVCDEVEVDLLTELVLCIKELIAVLELKQSLCRNNPE